MEQHLTRRTTQTSAAATTKLAAAESTASVWRMALGPGYANGPSSRLVAFIEHL